MKTIGSRSRQVSPGDAELDLGDQVLRDSENFGELGLGASAAARSNNCDVGRRKLGLPIGGASGATVSASLDPVANIVESCPGLEVRGVAAKPHVAFVANHKAGRDGAVAEFKGNAVGTLDPFRQSETPVVIRVLTGQPWPAIVRPTSVDLAPKTLYDPFIHGSRSPLGLGPNGANRCGPFFHITEAR